ncbi:MAG: DMT family transporter [Fervidicoccaceae archaeon]
MDGVGAWRPAGLLAAPLAATIWALIVFPYRSYMRGSGPLALNARRLLYAAVLSSPAAALKLEPSRDLLFAAASGLFGLWIGDTLYFGAIRRSGPSVAAPVAYTYIVLSQFAASLLGERLRPEVVTASLIAFAGVVVVSSGEGRAGAAGIAYALGAALSWVASVSCIKLASESVDFFSIAYARVAAAALAAWIQLTARGRAPSPLPPKGWSALPLIAVLDLVVGGSLFALSIGALGVSPTVVVISLSPAITQIYARLTGVELVGPRKMIGAGLIIAASILVAMRGA